MSSNHVIIVAGGAGSRMNQVLPKQFTLIHEVPVLVHTIRAFLLYDPAIHVLLVLPESHLTTWRSIQEQYLPSIKVEMVIGGETRYQSVQNGLARVHEGLVGVHDAVRPCVSQECITATFEAAQKYGSGIPCVPLKDSIREVVASTSKTVDRQRFQIVQTPQTFQVPKLKKAFLAPEQPFFTDDASVYEYVLGEAVHLVGGDYENIKITTPEDLRVVSLFLQASTSKKP